jgi:hypothetical protein
VDGRVARHGVPPVTQRRALFQERQNFVHVVHCARQGELLACIKIECLDTERK